ncbi:TonB-dependent receptor [Aquabacterium sp. A7-Y]|uniref:TonB-dependent receptor n=1 Tax=Aquabacterium sp. A7-Y TaxID=1349605 RepID=UPI00223E2C7D|nr:TonB-dependent receptor [Aquabacterium sp. A7-Y]MCW7541550.1 TonB-dependent receptor [Aquabacterium sp. A7-Y]
MRDNTRFQGRAVAACVAVLCGGTTPVALAQVSSATLRGVVSADGKPQAQAGITATRLATGQTARTTSRSDGSYVLTGLAPGEYRIEAQASGFPGTSQRVVLQVGQAASLNLQVSTQPVSLQAVTVTGSRLVENKTSEVGTYVTPRQMERLPQVTRNFLSFAELAPGVSFTTTDDGSTRLQGGAQRATGVNVFIDGVSQKNYVTQGGISGQDSSRGNPFPQSAISEYKVLTQNYKAEYDQLTSAAITAVTKSGTNEFHGDVFVDHSQGSWRASTPAEKEAGKKVDSKQTQSGLTLGGPIVKDKLHYFMAFERKDNRDPQAVTPGEHATVEDVPPAYRGLLGPVNVPFKQDLLFAKLDWSVDDANQLELSLKYRDERETTNLKGQATEPWSTHKNNDETRVALKHQYSADDWVNEARLSYERSYWNPKAATLGPGLQFTTGWDKGNAQPVLNVGGGEDFQKKGQKGYALQDDLTFTDIEWRGRHIVKTGIKLKSITVDAQEQQPYNPQYFIDVNGNGDPYKVHAGMPLTGVGDGSARSRNLQLGLYVQDDWEVNEHLTLNLGLRWDYERSPSYLDYKTPADVVTALTQTPYAANLAAGGVNVQDYISDGGQRKPFKKAFQPRLGFSWDFEGDQRSVLYGGYGRAYDRNIFDFLQLERTKGTYAKQEIVFGPGEWKPEYYTPEGLAELLASRSGGAREIVLMHNKLKVPHSDQFSLGFRKALGEWNTDIGVSHVRSKNGFTFLLGNRRDGGRFFDPGTVWGAPSTYHVPGYGSLILGTSGLETRTTALFLQAQKPYTRLSGWGLTVAYTYAHARENRDFEQHYSLDYPDLKGYGWKPSSSVSKHKLVAALVQDLPWWGLEGSVRLSYASGRPQYYINESRGEGQFFIDQLERGSTRQVDVALGKEFPVREGMKLRLRADVLNLFNARNYARYKTTAEEFGRPDGSLAGPPRTVKVTLGASW